MFFASNLKNSDVQFIIAWSERNGKTAEDLEELKKVCKAAEGNGNEKSFGRCSRGSFGR